MHALAPLIRDLAVILGVASIVALLFQKIRQPVVLGYLIAGAIIGPYTPPHSLVSDTPNIQIISELGVIFLMFSLGLEFSFHKLKRVGFSAGITGFFEVVCMLLIGLAVGALIGWSFYDSLFLGAAIAISSTTIIIKALEELNLKRKRFADLIFGVLIVEDLLAILLLVALTTIVTTKDIFSFAIAGSALKLILVVGGWFLIGYFLVPPLFRRIMHYANEEVLTVVSIALCLLLVCVANYFHYSTALGAFIMGSILAETPLVHRISQLIQPIRNIFAAVFFVSIGMLINPILIWQQLPLIMLICVITIIGKLLTTGLGAFLTGQSVNNSVRIGFSMAQIGEFSFIIAGLGLALKATSSTLYPLIVAVSAITTFTTPYCIKFSGYVSQKLDKTLSGRTKYFLDNYATWIYRLQAGSNKSSGTFQLLIRWFINGVLIAIIFIVTENWVLSFFMKILAQNWFAKIIGWLVAMLVSSPFIWGMLTAFRVTASSSQRKEVNSIPLAFFLGLFLLIVEIIILSFTFFDTWFVSIFLLLAAFIYFRVLYKQIDKSYLWFEKKLVDNLNKQAAHQIYYEKLAPWDTHFIEAEVDHYPALANKSLRNLQMRQQFGINVVAIYRDAEALLSPKGDEVILASDKLVLLGNDEQIEAFDKYYAKKFHHSETTNLLENFTLKTILLDSTNSWLGKSIRDSGILKQSQGLIVGIERDEQRILNPDSETILREGDLIFIVGEYEHLKILD